MSAWGPARAYQAWVRVTEWPALGPVPACQAWERVSACPAWVPGLVCLGWALVSEQAQEWETVQATRGLAMGSRARALVPESLAPLPRACRRHRPRKR